MSTPLNILLVEDSEDDALLLLRQMNRSGFQVYAERVDDEDGMRQALESRSWDVIIADYAIPGFGGLAALNLVKSLAIDVPFIIVSGTIGEESAVEAMKAGAHDYVMKGHMARLVPAIEREVRESAMRRDRKQAESALSQSESRYRGLFENSPISIWEEDFSGVRQIIDRLQAMGVTDFRTYLRQHPEVVQECALSVRVLDVNQTTLRMYGAETKEALLSNLETILGQDSGELIAEEVAYLAEGKQEYYGRGINYRLNGEPLHVSIRWTIMPEYEQSLSRIIVSITDVTERHNAEAQIHRQLERLAALRTVDSAINSSLDLRVTLDVLLNQVLLQLQVDAADVMLVDSKTRSLGWAAGRGFRRTEITRYRSRIGESFAGTVAAERRLVCIPDLRQVDNLGYSPHLMGEDFITYYGVPLISKGQVKGVLEVYQRSPLLGKPEWLEFLETLAGQAAIAIDNAVMFNDLQRSNLELAMAYDTTLEGWSRALDLRDKETEGHTRRVADMTVRLAVRLGLEKQEINQIRRGALLHDIGKMGIPDSILLKPGPLTEAEWEVMRRHPVYAYEWLSPIPYLLPALDIPYCHHEKWNGTGYPRQLCREAIPIAARIFSVIDVWDALSSDRPYRPAWSAQKVHAYIREQAGEHFDPDIIPHFLEMLEDEY